MKPGLPQRIARLDWARVEADLDARGHALTPPLLSPAECGQLAALWDAPRRFRSEIDMAPRRYGEGMYRYFRYPLPAPVKTLRTHFYPPLARIANRWAETLREEARFPPRLKPFLETCHAAGQTRPTPLLLRYERDGYNCLHQDRYGALAFPLQVALLLSRPDRDFSGGAFLLVEQRPRAQSVGHAVGLKQGQALIFPNAVRPVLGKRGPHRVTVRHGVSRLESGLRYTLGLIFHDAT